jgi:hypothetical protein
LLLCLELALSNTLGLIPSLHILRQHLSCSFQYGGPPTGVM